MVSVWPSTSRSKSPMHHPLTTRPKGENPLCVVTGRSRAKSPGGWACESWPRKRRDRFCCLHTRSSSILFDHGADRTIVAACLPSRWVGGCTQLPGDQGLRARPLVRFSPGLTISFSGQISVFSGNGIPFRNFGKFRRISLNFGRNLLNFEF